MFEDLDDPNPPSPASVEGVRERGRRLRMHRRMLAGAVVMFVVAGAIVSAAALQSNGHKKVEITNEPTTSIDSTVPVTDTTAPETTTTDTTPASTVAAPPTSASTTTTQPPHDPHDYSMVAVTYPDAYGPSTCTYKSGVDFACSHLVAIDTGTSIPITYTVTNNGPWTVDLGDCATRTVDLWSDINRAGQGPFSEGIWPLPYPSPFADAVPEGCAGIGQTLPPGQSVTLYETILAGYHNAAGDVMPAPPGLGSFVPGFLECAQPCDTYPPNSLAVSIWPPNTTEAPGLVITVKTLNLQAASGASVPVEMTYTNPLAFTVRTPVFGPCWTVKSGTAQIDCSGPLPAIVIGPHQTVDLVGTIWARKGFTATGAPLAPGKYGADLGDLHGSEYSVGPPEPVLTVTP